MRLQVARKSDLAVRALTALGRHPGRVKGAMLADEVGTTTALLPQILQPLVAAGWVGSTTGPTGGYELLADLGDLSVLEIVEAVEGPTDAGRCVLAEQDCPSPEPCALHDAWSIARDALTQTLGATSLASLSVPDGAPQTSSP